MSSIGFGFLLDEVSKNLNDATKIEAILNATREAKLIAEDSESYNAQVNPDNAAEVVKQLISDLKKKGKLEIDKLETLRNLLKGVKEWSLIDKVDNFAKEREDFTSLIDNIIDKLDKLDCLDKLISIFAGFIEEEAKEDIKDVRKLFSVLEKNKHLGYEELATLKTILKDIGEKDLLDEVTEFEKRRKKEEAASRRRDQFADALQTVIVAPATGLYSTLKHAGEQLIGAVRIHCNFSTVSGISLAVSSGIILYQGAQAGSLREFADAFKIAVLPAALALRALSEGSLYFTVQAENSTALKELWERYKDGTLQRNLEEFLITDDVKQLAGGEEVILTVDIDEQEFNDAYLSLIVADKQEHLKKEIENIRTQLTEGSSLGGEPSPSTHAAVASSETEYSSRGRPVIQVRPGLKRLRPAAESDVLKGREVGDPERPEKKQRWTLQGGKGSSGKRRIP